MIIKVLDGYGVNPGDLSWDKFESLGEFTVYERTTAGQVLERSLDADVLLTNKTPLPGELLRTLPHLKYIGVLATGYNIVDILAAQEAGIIVTHIPAYSTNSVAQMVFAHLLSIIQRVDYYTQENRKGRWSTSPDFCYWDMPLSELAGKCFGIVGLGHIGQAVARIALAFGMDVKAYTSKDEALLPQGISKVSLDELFSTCDIISLHCPLNEQTYHLVNATRLKQMKSTAILINTGRGPLIDEKALAQALNNGTIHAAGLDVLSTEPPAPDNPLFGAKNCTITPHIAWATLEARQRLMDIAFNNLFSFLHGTIINRVTDSSHPHSLS